MSGLRVGGSVGAGPTPPAARSMRSRAPEASSQRQAPSPAWCRGSAGHPTSPHLLRAALSPGHVGAKPRTTDLGAGSPPRQVAHPSLPAPHPERGSAPGLRATGSWCLFHPQTFGQGWKGVPFSSNRPHPHPLQLPATSTFPCYLADGQTGDTKKKKEKEKKTLPPLQVPSSSLEPGGSRGGSTSSLLLPLRIR